MLPEVFARWHTWSRQYEKMWVKVVEANMRDGYLGDDDPVVTARLILGMLIWVSRWYRPIEKMTTEEIADAAIHLLRLGNVPKKGGGVKRDGQVRRSPAKKRG